MYKQPISQVLTELIDIVPNKFNNQYYLQYKEHQWVQMAPAYVIGKLEETLMHSREEHNYSVVEKVHCSVSSRMKIKQGGRQKQARSGWHAHLQQGRKLRHTHDIIC